MQSAHMQVTNKGYPNIMLICPWPEEIRAKYLDVVNNTLVSLYGLPRHGNKRNPLDEAIYILLSSQTDEMKYQNAYKSLKHRFVSWNNITNQDELEIARIIQPAGLSRVKAKNIIGIIDKVKSDFGKASLSTLQDLAASEAENYLCTLPGIGKKSARCILLYSFDQAVFPVDTHNFRVLKRLGTHDLPLPIRRWHNSIQNLIPDGIRFSLHVTLISFGRNICTAINPKCNECPLSSICCYYLKTRNSL